MSDWRHEAACLEEDPELFFPIGNTGPAILQIEMAKEVCRRCDVVQTCLDWAIDTGQDAGVWGGLSEDERRGLKRRTARAARANRPAPAPAPPKPEPRYVLVDAAPAREILIKARESGWSNHAIARLVAVPPDGLLAIGRGDRQRIASTTAEKILAKADRLVSA